ncbi:helix-turn-helix domain-containing protein [Allohahella sp. A8]|uniref:helix-turn-helix domain-containing protein n=1 Tax=Allohahella sp. A8 TaxID=3141461 RepID=UPI003A801D97
MLKQNLGKNMITRREALGLERKDLHARCGVSVSQIGYIENAREKNNITLDVLDRLSEGLKMPGWALILPDNQFVAGRSDASLKALKIFEGLDAQAQDKALAYLSDLSALQAARTSKP